MIKDLYHSPTIDRQRVLWQMSDAGQCVIEKPYTNCVACDKSTGRVYIYNDWAPEGKKADNSCLVRDNEKVGSVDIKNMVFFQDRARKMGRQDFERVMARMNDEEARRVVQAYASFYKNELFPARVPFGGMKPFLRILTP